jgi:hypothetical protein
MWSLWRHASWQTNHLLGEKKIGCEMQLERLEEALQSAVMSSKNCASVMCGDVFSVQIRTSVTDENPLSSFCFKDVKQPAIKILVRQLMNEVVWAALNCWWR